MYGLTYSFYCPQKVGTRVESGFVTLFFYPLSMPTHILVKVARVVNVNYCIIFLSICVIAFNKTFKMHVLNAFHNC